VYLICVLALLGGLVAAMMSFVGTQRTQALGPSACALAQDFSTYRTAVIRYVQTTADPGFSGSVPDANLAAVGVYAPGQYAPNPLWRNYVQGNFVVVYAASMPSVNFVGALEQIALSSVFAGTAYDNTVVSSTNATTPSDVLLPAAANVPNGVPVWEARDVF
jgi:hypothetical protein